MSLHHQFGVSSAFSWVRMTRFGPRETHVITANTFPDGTVIWMGTDYLYLGTRPLTLKEEVGREARLMVREGMRDIVEWLGWVVMNEPSSEQILSSLRENAEENRFIFSPQHNIHIRA